MEPLWKITPWSEGAAVWTWLDVLEVLGWDRAKLSASGPELWRRWEGRFRSWCGQPADRRIRAWSYRDAVNSILPNLFQEALGDRRIRLPVHPQTMKARVHRMGVMIRARCSVEESALV